MSSDRSAVVLLCAALVLVLLFLFSPMICYIILLGYILLAAGFLVKVA